MIDKIYALYWDFLQIPYFKVFVMKENTVIKVFNQRAITSQEGSDIALIDKANKMAWWINKDNVRHKSRFMFFVNINNAMPLIINDKITTTELMDGLIIKEIKETKMKVDKNKKETTEKKLKRIINGVPSKLAEISYPPTVFYQMIEAHFVVKITSKPKNKWEELAPVLIVVAIIVGLILWQYLT